MSRNLPKLLNALLLLAILGTAKAQTLPQVKTAGQFAVFNSVGAITSTGNSQYTGNVGSGSGIIAGFGNFDGQMHSGDAAAMQAATDLDTLINQINAGPCDSNALLLTANNRSFKPGTYCITTSCTLSGNIVLDAHNNPNAVFIFIIDGVFTANAATTVTLANGAQACRVFWMSAGIITIGSNAVIKGNVISNSLALSPVLIGPGANIEGSVLSTSGAITINNSVIRVAKGCGLPVSTGPVSPNLRSANCYALFSDSGSLVNTGSSTITGKAGTNSGTVTGLSAANVSQGVSISDASTQQCKVDIDTAYNYITALPYDIDLAFPGTLGNKLLLSPHVYRLNSNTSISDTLFLDAGSISNSVFVFKINGNLSTAANAKIVLLNGAKACNVFWQVTGTSNTGAGTGFAGSLIGNDAITLGNGSVIDGRMLTRLGDITSNAINAAIPTGCGGCPYSPVNNIPHAVDDHVNIQEDAAMVNIDVLQNDNDPDGDVLSVSILTPAKHGSSAMNGNVVSYQPGPNFHGFDTIVYLACDNKTPALCDTALVLITVASVNDAPVAADDTASTLPLTPVSINVRANDTDADNDTLTVSILHNPKHGLATVINNFIIYTPTLGFLGYDTLYYRVCDTGIPALCDSAMVVIHVRTGLPNRAPVAADDLAYTLRNDPVTVDVLANDNDPDGDVLSIDIVATPNHGSALVSARKITYNPSFNYTGYDTLYYEACDNNGLCDTAMLVIGVEVNAPPVANNDTAKVCQGSTVTVNVQANDTDPNGDSFTTSIRRAPAHGTATLSGNSIVYTPNNGYQGWDSILYQVCDNVPASLCDSAWVFVRVNAKPVTDAGDNHSILKGQSATLGTGGSNGHSYLWSPATGLNDAHIADPLAKPSVTTRYTLLEVIDSTGCSNTDSVLVSISEPPLVTPDDNFYNGISPNGDGSNDWWNIPFLESYPDNSVSITNRLGTMVWRTDNYDNSSRRFEGKNANGNALPDGAYFYDIRYGNNTKQGWIMIKR